MSDKLKKYCPYCQRDILPSNIEDVERGEHDGYIYVHDAVPHCDDYNGDDLQ